MKRLSYLTVAVTGLGLACSVAQADLKDPIPDSLSLGGVTVYGTVDVGYAYQSHGVPINGQLPGGLEYQAFTTTRNYAGSVSTVAESGLEQSKVGIRVSEPIGDEFSFVAQAETGFNPLSAQLTDACNSLATNAGKPQGEQTANADSSRCGQAFNSVLYGGTSSKDYGTLTIGRQNSLQLAQLLQYDPQQLSYAFSFLGYSGFNGGSGSTQAARWDNSVLYAYRNSMFHVAAMYGNGGQDTGYFGKAYGADVGVTWQGLSVDATYQKINSAVNLRSSFDDGTANPLPTPGLAAYVSTNTSYNVMGKYTLEFGDAAPATRISKRRMGTTRPVAPKAVIRLMSMSTSIATPNTTWSGWARATRSTRIGISSVRTITSRRTAGRSVCCPPAIRASAAPPARACSARGTSMKPPVRWTMCSTSTTTCMPA